MKLHVSEPTVTCPLCHTAEATRKVSTPGGGETAGTSSAEEYGSGYLPWRPPEWTKPSTTEDDWSPIYFLLGGLLLLIPAAGFAYVGVSSLLTDTAGAPLNQSDRFVEHVLLIVLAATLLLVAGWLLLSPSARPAQTTVQELNTEDKRQYEVARNRWAHLHFCEKHRIVFVPGLPSYADAGDPAQIEALLYL